MVRLRVAWGWGWGYLVPTNHLGEERVWLPQFVSCEKGEQGTGSAVSPELINQPRIQPEPLGSSYFCLSSGYKHTVPHLAFSHGSKVRSSYWQGKHPYPTGHDTPSLEPQHSKG